MRKTLSITGYEVTFSHPKVGSLVIDTGAESLSWEYGLNTVVKPTLGGEVVQILSAYVGSISISGSTRTNDELLTITNWFKRYMLVAAGPDGNRDQTPVTFRLASRQWSFDMWVTSTPPLEYRTDLIAAPWSVTGEVAGDSSANDLAQATQSSLTDALTSKTFLHTVGWKGNLGANALRLIDPKNVSNSSSDVDNIFENISRAVASLTTGDASFLSDFDATKDPDTQFNGKDADDFYTAAFGTKYLTGDDSTGSAAAGIGDIGNDRASIIAGIKQVFEAKDIPAELGVLIALVETGGTLNPDARQPNGDHAVGLFQTFPGGAGTGRSFSSKLDDAFNDTSHPVTKHYTPVMQITAASEWIAAARNGSDDVTLSPKGTLKDKTDFTRIRAWAQAAQNAGVDYRTATKVVGYWNEAVRLVKEFGNADVTSNIGKPIATGVKSAPFGEDRKDHTHEGVDLAAPVGTPVYAVVSGKVEQLSDPNGYGTYLILKGSNGDDYLYGHLSSYAVSNGTTVVAGRKIALSGNTGHSTGPHLHFEYHPGGYRNPKDPWPLIKRFFK